MMKPVLPSDTLYWIALYNVANPNEEVVIKCRLTHVEIQRHGSFMKLYLIAREYREGLRSKLGATFVTRRVTVFDRAADEERPLVFAIPDRGARWLRPFDNENATHYPPTQWPCARV